MNKDEILAKARQENNYQDLEKDSLKNQSRRMTRWILFAVGAVLVILQAVSGHIEEAVLVRLMIWAMDIGESLYIAVRRKQKKDWAEAAAMLGLLLWDGSQYMKHLFG